MDRRVLCVKEIKVKLQLNTALERNELGALLGSCRCAGSGVQRACEEAVPSSHGTVRVCLPCLH